ncbi:hypothetical protein NFI96_032433 [Prochilodus magdalenae]|nr:hypothetical protein NFI96_032433 [Prochilodus magdalenae]
MTVVELLNKDWIQHISGRANLKMVLPKYYQHIKFPTRGEQILDHCYTTLKDSYNPLPHPAFGKADHTSVLFLPAYKQRLKQAKPVLRSVYQYREEAIFTLQDCFETTYWKMFCDAAGTDINEYTDSITCYISKCTDDIFPRINVRTFPNHKIWINTEGQAKLRARTTAYNTSDLECYKKDRYDLQRTIRLAKRNYRDRVESNYRGSDLRRMWNDLCVITDYKVIPTCFKRTTNVPVPKKPTITCLKDYRPVALTSTAMKCFERLVKTHICSTLPATMDPYQFAYHSNRSTDDAIALTVHSALTHLNRKNTYVRMFIDYSSAFNTIILAKLIPKLTDMGLNSHLCNWILDFLTCRPQVRQGQPLSEWCYHNNLSLNISRTKEMIVDYRKLQRGGHSPLYINGAEMEWVSSVRFLRVHLTDDLTLSLHTNKVVRSACHRLFFLRRLRKFRLLPDILTNFYRCTIESILTACITVWYGSCTAYDRKALKRVVRTAESIIGSKLLDLQDIYQSRCLRKIQKIQFICSHPAHGLFILLPSGRRYRSIQAGTK